MEDSGRGVILGYYPGIRLDGLGKTTKNLKSGQPESGPRFEPGISRIRSRSVNHITTAFSSTLIKELASKDTECYKKNYMRMSNYEYTN
jgi:hypothetical protein